MNWHEELIEKENELTIIKEMISKYRKIERELKNDIESIKNMIVLEKHWNE